MDRKIQLTTLALLLTLFSFGQRCDTSRITLVKDTCDYVIMSPEMFTKFLNSYQIMEEVSPLIPTLSNKVKELSEVNEKLRLINKDELRMYEKAYVDKIDRLNKQLKKERKKHKLTIVISLVIITVLICN